MDTVSEMPGDASELTTVQEAFEAVKVFIIVIGVIGNFLSLIVWTRPKMKSPVDSIMTGIAIWDLINLIGSLLQNTLPSILQPALQSVQPYFVVYLYPVSSTAHTGMIWLTVTLAAVRYLAVCHPIQTRVMCKMSNVRVLVMVVSLLAIVFNFCCWFEYQIIDESPRTMVTLNCTPFGADSGFRTMYYGFFSPFVLFVLPVITMSVLTLLLVGAMRRSQRLQETMVTSKQNKNRITKKVLYIVLIFFIFQIPSCIYNILYSYNKICSPIHGQNTLTLIKDFGNILHSTVNCFMYCGTCQRFKSCFKQTFCLQSNESSSLTALKGQSSQMYNTVVFMRGRTFSTDTKIEEV